MAKTINFRDTDMQSIIGWVLRIGVFVSISVVIFGGIVYLYRHGHEVVAYRKFTGVPDFVKPVKPLLQGVFDFRGRAIMQTGIILLIFTPVIRVLFSAFGFIFEKDWLYTGITFLVLLIICFSIFSGHAG